MVVIITSNWVKGPQTINMHTFAIGDLHGRYDLLDQANKLIEKESLLIKDKFNLIYLGDYIDRGPNSLKCLDTVINFSLKNCDIHRLIGNHEELMLLSFLPNFNGSIFSLWSDNGGRSLLNEVSLALNNKHLTRDDVFNFMKPYFEKVVDFKTSVRFGNYVFVHGGVPFGYQPSDLSEMDAFELSPVSNRRRTESESPLWVRYSFIDRNEPWEDGLTVVHGHTIEKNGPTIRQNRIGIDAGAYTTGNLIVLELKEDLLRYHIIKE
jgi:serine/threonine protein phosphatase 1